MTDTLDQPEFMMIPADLVSKIEHERERNRQYSRKQQAANPSRSHHKLDDRPFIMWDGEGPHDTGYSLFGSSDGDEICRPGLSTVECLDLILARATKSDAIHVWYGGNYDASMILADLPERYLRQLKTNNTVVWRGYRIGYVPRKWLQVSNGKVTVKVFDVVSFFACPFLEALEKFKIGTPGEQAFIQSNKASRDTFMWADIEQIKVYWRMELKLGVMLMLQLRKVFQDAGFNPRSWHGPGALARMALKRHKVDSAMAVCPPDVRIAAMYAFAGGRFEMPRGGLINERIYNADLRSAYPHYARDLPNLANGRWRRCNSYEPGKFGLYHIVYKATDRRHGRIFPLFRRIEGGEVVWPADTEGWYHAPEAALVADDPDATFIEGWVFDEYDSTDKPFAWLADYFDKRMFLKSIGNPAEYTFKLIINSVYGQLAQRTGWDKRNRKAPRYHQLEWAGYITSACRAEVYRLALRCGDKLVSIDTDGIYARCPLPVQPGSALGDWELSEYAAGLFWQSGIYVLKDESDWTAGKTKSRGVPKGKFGPDAILSAFRNNHPLVLKRNVFHGFGICLNNQMQKLNTWSEDKIELAFGGQGKRYHNQVRCEAYCHERDYGIHEFISRPVRAGMSLPHVLPWLTEQSVKNREEHDMMVAFDINELDDDDRWVLDYAA